MANTYKNVVITPSRSSNSDDPKIVFSGANTTANTDITLRMYPTANGTLSFEGSAGQLFSITNDLTGTIYSVNDVSGIPSIAVFANGQVDVARFGGNTFFGTNNHVMTIIGNTWNNSTGTGLVVKGYNSVGSGITLQPLNSSSYSAGWSLYAGAAGSGIGDGAFGFWNHTTSSYPFWTDQGGNTFSSVSSRAPIFYDSNDTGYYVNPNASSQFSSLNCNGDFKTNFISGSGGSTFSANHYSMGKDIANGSWSAPHYSDLIIGYHTGVRIGGNYSGVRFYANSPTTDANNDGNGDGGEALLMTVGGYVGTANGTDVYVNNNLFAGSSMRAPIFYDSDNTSYYTNPAGVSVFSDVRINDNNVQLISSNVSRNTKWRALSGTTDVGISLYSAQDTWCMQLYANAGADYGFLNGNWAAWDIRKVPSGNLFLNNQGSYYLNGSEIFYNRVYGNTDIRSPVFYDYDDTGYYLNANGTSSLNRIAVVRSGNNVYTDADYGYGLVGAYSSYRYQGVYAMGDSYKLPADGTTTGSLYGMAWSHPNAGGTAGNLNSHGLLLLQNGSFMAALSTNGTFAADVRGTIFYDYSNTGYYLDPNGGTSINVAGAILAGGNITAYYSDERLKTKLGPIENAIDKVKTLDGFYYQANEVAQKLGYKVKRELGLSAQQVQAILPEIVAPAPIDNRYLTIHYERVVPLLVEAIKELNHKHETEIAELKQALAALLNKQ